METELAFEVWVIVESVGAFSEVVTKP